LIRDGAKLTETPDDILDELGLARPPAAARGAVATAPGPAVAARPLTPDGQKLLAALGHAPATLEMLAARTDMDGTALQGALLVLELGGHVSALPGGRYVRIAPR
jgi:DNA processing protein